MLGAGNTLVNKTDVACALSQFSSIFKVMVDILLCILYIHHYNPIHITFSGLVLFHKFIKALTGNTQINILFVTVLGNTMLPPKKNLLAKFVLKYIHTQILFSKVGGSIMCRYVIKLQI